MIVHITYCCSWKLSNIVRSLLRKKSLVYSVCYGFSCYTDGTFWSFILGVIFLVIRVPSLRVPRDFRMSLSGFFFSSPCFWNDVVMLLLLRTLSSLAAILSGIGEFEFEIDLILSPLLLLRETC